MSNNLLASGSFYLKVFETCCVHHASTHVSYVLLLIKLFFQIWTSTHSVFISILHNSPTFFWNRAGKLIIFALRATCVQTLHYFLQARNSISLWTVHPFMVNSILIFWCSDFTSRWRRHFCTLGLILTKDSFDSEASNRCWICCSGIFGDSRPVFSGFTCISYFGQHLTLTQI